MEGSEYLISNSRIELPGPGKLRVCQVAGPPREERLLSSISILPSLADECDETVWMTQHDRPHVRVRGRGGRTWHQEILHAS
ncbi:hypothetical protein N7510_006731 [Penicillium lagena]|uniref:uncharacterized protein n=1 Tax=Penicillium lagena TaxID=94218 RepID=UPI0025405517|nr:uncharacterized protein N7510_006731 [Penicillium lagena]KAJ5610012.1 hypothetical protein N7510_006731 [Penicillium lagena]